MKSTHRIAAAALALALLGAGGAAADHKKDTVAAKQLAGTVGAKVIAVQTWVENLTAGAESRYGIHPTNEPIPVNVGDRVRVRLVGTAIEGDGDGVEIPIHARFSEASGSSRLDILERGPNWVVVRIGDRDRRRNDDRAQLAFEVTGRYDMRNNLESGRITFDLGGRGGSSLGLSQGATDRDRSRESERLTTLLYDAILRENPSSRRNDSEFREDADRIYRDGYEAVVEVALELAREAQERNVFRDHSAREVVAYLYRTLLGRSGSDSQLASDPGFIANVRQLERGRLYDLIETIVRSEEFHRTNSLTGFARLR
ncbi:MAG TPA: hypothetical protein VNJ70_12485 [Thermoanaerobaculia bacterium]|nr:hypothetical protein [Thermoanaerobaculia bacterium]